MEIINIINILFFSKICKECIEKCFPCHLWFHIEIIYTRSNPTLTKIHGILKEVGWGPIKTQNQKSKYKCILEVLVFKIKDNVCHLIWLFLAPIFTFLWYFRNKLSLGGLFCFLHYNLRPCGNLEGNEQNI